MLYISSLYFNLLILNHFLVKYLFFIFIIIKNLNYKSKKLVYIYNFTKFLNLKIFI